MSDESTARRSPQTLVEIRNPKVRYEDHVILSRYNYEDTKVEVDMKNRLIATPRTLSFMFRTERRVPRVGCMIVGWGGNNGTTLTAGILANRHALQWETKDGIKTSNYFGSITQASTIRLGTGSDGRGVYVPLSSLLPMVHPNDLVVGGWDISSMNMYDAMRRARVLDVDLQRQLKADMSSMIPLRGVYIPSFIAANQRDRADNVLEGTKTELLQVLRRDIQNFKRDNKLDKVIVIWSANTERFCSVQEGLNNTADELLTSIAANKEEVSPSTLYATAALLEGCSFINGSPQNTLVPGIIDLAARQGVFVGGDDFKSGQTKVKSVLVDYLVSAGIKPVSIASYNHLGNNDGKNLSAPAQFRSKEISKTNVVDDVIESNSTLYAPGEGIDHCVVIKYMPAVGDTKVAMDEYQSEIFMGGKNTLVTHQTCEDSLLAAPLILDLVIIAELCERIRVKRCDQRWHQQMPADSEGDAALQQEDEEEKGSVGVEAHPAAALGSKKDDGFERLDPVLSILSFLLKAPVVPTGTPVVNALFSQRQCLVNILRAAIGLPPESFMLLEQKLRR